ncbi:MAG: SDR family NAD(P)-dependent oxidoreductase [Dehalococcoidia bacterium]
MAQPLADRCIVITGAGRGIGAEVARFTGSLGARVLVNDPGVNIDGSGGDAGPAQSVANEIVAAGGTAAANLDSIATEAGGENLIRQCLDTWGRVDGVVHVAGILRDRMIFNMSPQEWDDVIAVHLTGYFNLAKPASVIMRQQRFGRVIAFSSSSGLMGNAGQANYGAAKAGIAGGVRCLARDLGRYGITSNGIAPTAGTRMTQSIPEAAPLASGAVARAEEIEPPFPEARFVAPMVAYLLTDQAWNVNGKIFHVAGGQVSLAYEEVPDRSIAKAGMWTVDELRAVVPEQLMSGVINPAPPPPTLDLPGRPATP